MVSLLAGDAWKTKSVSDWTGAETKEVLTESPWAAMVTPAAGKETRPKGNRGGGFAIGPIGIGGIGRRRSPGEPAQDPNDNSTNADPQPFNVRWESALPIREAELKARETSAPAVDEAHYAIAVYGIPSRFAKDPRSLADHLKNQAALRRDGRKDLKPSHVDVMPREDGVAVVFLFPRTSEIGAKDSRVDFDAQIGPYRFTQSFHPNEMIYHGKMEL